MPGTLHIVATPIGNLEDITLRALRVLGQVALIAAEDTRRTGKLLTHYNISTRTLSYHEHNSKTRMPVLMRRLEANEDLALVTDAGTPGVSDPGAELVDACVRARIRVEPVPGVSAPLAAAIASGFPLIPLTILGFPPTRPKARTEWLADLDHIAHTVCFFEAPHRIQLTLADLADLLGERQIVVARELTKVHEEFLRGPASTISELVTSPRGEFTVMVGPAPPPVSNRSQLSDAELMVEFGRITEFAGLNRREAISQLAKRTNRAARDVYAAIERSKHSGV